VAVERISGLGTVLGGPLSERLAELIALRLRLLGQPRRLLLLDQLARFPETTVQELADRLGTTQQNVSQHLGILFRAGLLSRHRDGTHVHYALADPTIAALLDRAAASINHQRAELADAVEPDPPSDIHP
jgi:ArsR family transcriptional regulator